jgi:type I restriction enzyme S subunit
MGEVGMLCTNDKVFLGQRIVSYRVDKMKVDPGFLLLAFQSLGLKKQIDKLASGATVQHLRVPHTKEFEFNVPPLIVQQSIVQKLDALSAQTKKLDAIYQQKITDLEELKKSILQKAFSGELKTVEMLAV